MFNSTHDVSIGGNATLSVVHRDQYNQTTINAQVVHIGISAGSETEREKEHDRDPEYNQYHNIIRGDLQSEKTLFEQYLGARTERGRFTDFVTVAVPKNYSSSPARWRRESFYGLLISWCGSFEGLEKGFHEILSSRLFGINRSKVPALLFYDEWLPLGHFQEKVAENFWENYYLSVYANAWYQRTGPNSSPHDLWLNSRTGRISSGPEGARAYSERTKVVYNYEDMPSALEMANSIDSLGCHDGKDHLIWTKDISHDRWWCDACSHIACDKVQDFIGKLRLDTVYSGVQLDKIAFLQQGPVHAWETYSDPLRDGTLIDGGLTRFQLNTEQFRGYFYLSQAHRTDLSTSGSETCFIPHLFIEVKVLSHHKDSSVPALESSTLSPIVYLFLRPPPPSLPDLDPWLSRVSFWSLDRNGISEIPETECKRMGLPIIILDQVELYFHTWPKYVYDGLHAWQVARGFDIATADFARSLGLPTLEPAITRFEGGVEEEEPTPISDSLGPNSKSDEVIGEMLFRVRAQVLAERRSSNKGATSSSTGSWCHEVQHLNLIYQRSPSCSVP
uniref:Uncharacterized protein n=1 Tax=Moniliophthora roreri TaxID=221103 RepID=A0A0W0FXK7_MONRR